MNHQHEAIKAVAAYLGEGDYTWGDAAARLRDLIEIAAKEYAIATTPQHAYETLASIALETFNADQAKRKGEQP